MKTSIPTKDIKALLQKQISSLFILENDDVERTEEAWESALARAEKCFAHVQNKYYHNEADVVSFDPYHSCQWTVFLYLLANEIFHQGGGVICEKLYGLQKALSGADIYYQVELPEVFFFDHPVGSVIGRAEYSNYFDFGQGCTVGNNKGVYPTFGESVFMMSDSKVLGNCRIGDYVIIGANTYVKDQDVPSGSLVFGQSPNLIIKENRLDYVMEHAKTVFKYE